ncbi:MAG TPA: decarboxylating NADP(+)-dependent phosphogluconate dehydrogenase, partial [Spirochaetia bacterium]|nr:decarboxylating NADP(+)-dependent phosphogluconate dehydrogenase [Spirochaetia bacterium]
MADIGLIGLAVMGQNLVLNIADHGYSVAVYNRTTEKVDDFIDGPAKGKEITGTHSVEQFIAELERPRRIVLMVKAGPVVDKFIEQLLPHLEAGDIVIDGGNSHFPDTMRRVDELAEKGILFVGTGVSGGEEGARNGPSIMPGGNAKAWPHVKEILQSISAKTPDGEPCCDWVGDGGAGHYVKMVHNGIEYGDMQLIAEAYHLMVDGMGMTHDQIHDVFEQWNQTELDSFLIEITRDIVAFADDDGKPLVEKILDSAGQKGTGKWTAINALEQGMPVTLIGEAVFARTLSARKDERVEASKVLQGPVKGSAYAKFDGDMEAFVEDIRKALLASKIISYAQGFMLMAAAAAEYEWSIDYAAVANMWRGGCIIRSVFLGDIAKAYEKEPGLKNLVLADYFRDTLASCQTSWRKVIGEAARLGIPVPALGT